MGSDFLSIAGPRPTVLIVLILALVRMSLNIVSTIGSAGSAVTDNRKSWAQGTRLGRPNIF